MDNKLLMNELHRNQFLLGNDFEYFKFSYRIPGFETGRVLNSVTFRTSLRAQAISTERVAASARLRKNSSDAISISVGESSNAPLVTPFQA